MFLLYWMDIIIPRTFLVHILPPDIIQTIISFCSANVLELYRQREPLRISEEFWMYYLLHVIEDAVRISPCATPSASFSRHIRCLCRGCFKRVRTQTHVLRKPLRYCTECFQTPALRILAITTASEAYGVTPQDIVKSIPTALHLCCQCDIESMVTEEDRIKGRKAITFPMKRSYKPRRHSYPYEIYCTTCGNKASIHCISGKCSQCCIALSCFRHRCA